MDATSTFATGVRAKVQVKVTQSERLFGVVAKGMPTWTWFVGASGRCAWIHGDSELPGRKGERPTLVSSKLIPFNNLEQVDVVLFQGCRPGVEHPVWSSSKTRAVLWTTSGFRRTDKRPEGWSFRSKVLSHCALGGVSNGRFSVYLGSRIEDLELSWRSPSDLFPNFLKQVWNPMEGGRLCALPGPGSEQANTVMGLVDWKSRHSVNVSGPTVYSKSQWSRRRLSLRELSDVADMPAVKFVKAGEAERHALTAQPIPGKILAEAIAMLTWESNEVALNKRSHSPTEELTFIKKSRVDPEADTTAVPSTSASSASRPLKRLAGSCLKELGDPIKKKPTLTTADDPPPEAGSWINGEWYDPGTPTVFDTPIVKTINDVALMTTVSAKAVKSDDASVPEYLWNERVLRGPLIGWVSGVYPRGKIIKALTTLRRFLLYVWKRKVEREFIEWFHSTEHFDDVRGDIWRAGMLACAYVRRASWWEWDGGSAILFWRWPLHYQLEARTGVPPYFDGAPPSSMNRQPPYKDSCTRSQVKSKIGKVISKGYITTSPLKEIRSLMYMFDVPKGADDIRMVYDGSKSGLNEALWSPWFALPTIEAMCRSLLPEYWCADNDYGDMFLNFPLHEDLQPFCGVDLSQILLDEEGGFEPSETFGQWLRNAMGLRPSPYNSVKGGLQAKRVILGNRHEPSNPFQWDRVVTNLPGDTTYSPTMPWIRKLRVDGFTATELLQYIDDLRTTAKDSDTAWAASSQIAKTLSWLGLQDAARKRREPSQRPGAWAGATVSTDGDNVYKHVTQERWEKTQGKIRWLGYQVGLWDDVSTKHLNKTELDLERSKCPGPAMIHHKTANSIRGFLVYVARTYTAMVPYLKGLHHSLDCWRPNRDEDGWKFAKTAEKFDDQDLDSAPTWVRTVGRFSADMKVLMDFTSGSRPPEIPVRPVETKAVYLVGDASGAGFGTSAWTDGDDKIEAEFGAWTEEISSESSNFREAYNLVLRIEGMVENGEIRKGTELFVFTDNSVTELAFGKGSSKSRLLHELVTRIRKLEMLGILFPHFIWIAGTRMIQQGTDGLSRGDLTCGVMGGEDFLEHIPLNSGAFERSESFRKEVLSWLPPDEDWKLLTTEDWFEAAFQDPDGKYVWAPPPALADVALEQLCEVRHIHPNTTHVFVCPALMTGRWRKQLGKVSDTMLTLPARADCWNANEHKPIVVSLTCPLLSRSPWTVKRSEWVAEWSDSMREVWRDNPKARRNHLCKFWLRAK